VKVKKLHKIRSKVECMRKPKKKLQKETFGERFIVPRQEFELNEAIR
jgi:hypothetical protein